MTGEQISFNLGKRKTYKKENDTTEVSKQKLTEKPIEKVKTQKPIKTITEGE